VLTTPIANAGIQLKNGATSAGFLEFFEDSDNGTNKVTLIGPASTADVTVTLPAETATLIGTATTDTLTNKTLTTPVINAGAQLKNGATSAGFLQFFEDSDNGTNKATLIGPASTADVTITLPAVTGTVLTTANSDVGTTTSTAAEADFILIDNGGVLNKISPNNLGITASSIGFTTSSFTTTPGSDGNFDLAKVQEQTGSAESGLTTVSFDAFGIETGGSPDFYDLMDPRFADKSTDYGSVA
jgi:preprotein translocase subunit Sec61beta